VRGLAKMSRKGCLALDLLWYSTLHVRDGLFDYPVPALYCNQKFAPAVLSCPVLRT